MPELEIYPPPFARGANVLPRKGGAEIEHGDLGLSVRELRVTGNAVKWTAILTGGSPTH